MFGKKKKQEDQEIARSALKGTPTRDAISETRDDMKRCIAWVSQSMVVTESKIGDK